ncbi:hypothetical protein JAAARDRAFT_408877 [Jaapia argillacea MUCL 33604]|uniref:Uncharacterized protein n=1 Tax=Jaapia argillacea MUCL 33604 TaxID=933084 RepID=A0A067PGK3_9AGAM|nr:hypothetical protein JAAARDRAFT_408877 [Jaapia argillacea MUCL 33604]
MSTLALPSNDLDQRRRKQTLERARANHLSRQLQMRLQYAKLKVEHGWQRQNLNEVENLYFHHSHINKPRPIIATSYEGPRGGVVSATRQSIPSDGQPRGPSIPSHGSSVGQESYVQASQARTIPATDVSSPSQTLLSTGEHTTRTRHPTEIAPASDTMQQDRGQANGELSGESRRAVALVVEGQIDSDASHPLSTRHGHERLSHPDSQQRSTPPPAVPLRTPLPSYPHPPLPSTSSIPPPPKSRTPINPSPTPTSSSRPSATVSTASVSAPNFGNSSLTYDSFWSTHSSSSNSYRNVLASNASRSSFSVPIPTHDGADVNLPGNGMIYGSPLQGFPPVFSGDGPAVLAPMSYQDMVLAYGAGVEIGHVADTRAPQYAPNNPPGHNQGYGQ